MTENRRRGWCPGPRGSSIRSLLPGGRELSTLRDAAGYITGLPKAELDAAEWPTAMETLLLVAEHGGRK